VSALQRNLPIILAAVLSALLHVFVLFPAIGILGLGSARDDDGLVRSGLDGDEGENWTRANYLLNTVEDRELVGPDVSPTELLVRLFHEERPRVFDPQPVNFGCTCSVERVRDSLSIYSAKDIGHMTTDDGIVTADCQFCGAHYELDPATLGFEATETPEGRSRDGD